VKTPVIILHRYPFSESSLVVKTLSPLTGVTSFLVKGARRKDSPFRVAFDPLALSEVVYQPSARRELQMPREALLVRYHEHMRANLETLAMGQVMAETVLRLSQAGGHYSEEYDLLASALAALDGDPCGYRVAETLARFLAELTDRLGFGLRLDGCVECKRPLHTPPADLWPALGGGICSECLGKRRPNWTEEFLQQIFLFQTSGRIEGPVSRIEHFFLQFLRIHSGHALHLHSMVWLDELRGIESSSRSSNENNS